VSNEEARYINSVESVAYFFHVRSNPETWVVLPVVPLPLTPMPLLQQIPHHIQSRSQPCDNAFLPELDGICVGKDRSSHNVHRHIPNAKVSSCLVCVSPWPRSIGHRRASTQRPVSLPNICRFSREINVCPFLVVTVRPGNEGKSGLLRCIALSLFNTAALGPYGQTQCRSFQLTNGIRLTFVCVVVIVN
jgi:hypothetical protein